ncbi:hypothetical protein SAMN06295912_101185 [Sphingomonas laterariae]|uniref:DUF1214 domain-containing protein n=1 Tax=Edaphosphingomonas laterariae TaxID=861865 RepID=A0A239BJN0_9SPHN|nr:hypothetical protein [Sphingomonas laterariae]SNS07591.1 hypothetical protein SAMN06295912_101185 [Sphingomonas laterariae]
MKRRDFIGSLGTMGAAALLPAPTAAQQACGDAPATQSRAAFAELVDLLQELDRDYLSPKRRIAGVTDISDGHRQILHHLHVALSLVAEADPDRPVFRRTADMAMKFFGDNPDALYYTAFIDPARTYRISGNTAGADFTSFSFERAAFDGSPSSGVSMVLDDRDLDISADGNFAFSVGPDQKFKLEPGVGMIQTRHYFETAAPVCADPNRHAPLRIEAVGPLPVRPAPDDASIAASIRRVANFLRKTTIDMSMMQPGKTPAWVSLVPNRFNPAEIPSGDIGFANRSAAYAMAPYALSPDQALVIEGRFPKCRFANVVLWNRYLQTYDYVAHTISRNRKSTTLLPDGRFRMVLAHRDPGVPNWIDTQGRRVGLVYWRFLLPEESIEPLTTRVVPLTELR